MLSPHLLGFFPVLFPSVGNKLNGKPREASQHATFFMCSPFKSGQRSFKKKEEKKAEPCSTDVISSSSPKQTGTGKTEAATQR